MSIREKMTLPTISDVHEYKVAEFLEKLGFTFLASRLGFKKSEAEMSREIDLLFTYQNCTFIVEVSTVKTRRNEKIVVFMYKWSKRKNLERLKEKFPTIPKNVMRIFFDLSKPIPENKSQEVEEVIEDKGNMVIYKDEFEKLNSNENIEQVHVDFLGTDWFEKTEKME